MDAPGGTGKTFTIEVICDFLRLRNKNVICVASSGVAAILLKGGRTAHSTFKIPIPCGPKNRCNLAGHTDLVKKMKEVDLIVWDEVLMCDRNCIEAVDRTLQDLRNNRYRFGGTTTLFYGDYRQLLPIVPGGSRGQIVHATCKRSPLNSWVQKLVLDQNMRFIQLMNDPNADEAALQYPNWRGKQW